LQAECIILFPTLNQNRTFHGSSGKKENLSRWGSLSAPLFWMYFRKLFCWKHTSALLKDISDPRCMDILLPFIASASSLCGTSHAPRKVVSNPPLPLPQIFSMDFAVYTSSVAKKIRISGTS
jgi:hypothetical protein